MIFDTILNGYLEVEVNLLGVKSYNLVATSNLGDLMMQFFGDCYLWMGERTNWVHSCP